MNYIIDEIEDKVIDKLLELKKIINYTYPNIKVHIDIPIIKYDSKSSRTLGYYNPTKDTIHLDLELLKEDTNLYINNVVTHEYAHYITQKLYGSFVKPHGKEFKSICRLFGIDGRATIKGFNNSKVIENRRVKRNIKRFAYTCDCGYNHQISTITHNRIQKGQYRACSICKSILRRA